MQSKDPLNFQTNASEDLTLTLSATQVPESNKTADFPKDIQEFKNENQCIFKQLQQHIKNNTEEALGLFESELKTFNKRYFALARKYHPDRNDPNEKLLREEQFKALANERNAFTNKVERLRNGQFFYDVEDAYAYTEHRERYEEFMREHEAFMKKHAEWKKEFEEQQRKFDEACERIRKTQEEIEKRVQVLEARMRERNERKEKLINSFISIFESIREAFSSIGESLSSAVDQLIAMRTQSNQESANQKEDVSPVQISEQLATKNNSTSVEQSSDYGDVLKKEGEESAKTEALSNWELLKREFSSLTWYAL